MAYRLRDRLMDVRDRIRAAPMVERAMSVRVEAPRRLMTWVLVVMALLGLFWLYGRHVEAAANEIWRGRIAASSAAVRAAIERGNLEVSVTDSEIIAILGESDARLTEAENRLANTPPTSVDGCSPIVRACLGLRE